MNADKAYERLEAGSEGSFARGEPQARGRWPVGRAKFDGERMGGSRPRDLRHRSRKERLQPLRRPERNHDLLYTMWEPIDARRYVE